MNFLIVNGHLHIGGVEKSLVNFLRSIDYSQHQVDLLLVEDTGEFEKEIPPQVNVFFYDLKPTYGSVRNVLLKAIKTGNLEVARQKIAITMANKINGKWLKALPLPKELRKTYDCAIAYRVGMPLDIVSYVINAKTKCVWWHHGEFDYSGNEVRKWHRAFERVDHIVCVSDSSRRMIQPFFPGLEEKMCVIPNMIIPEEIQRKAEAFDPYIDEAGKRILVSVGRMSAEKHMADTVDVMRELTNRGFDDLVWYLVGDGPERSLIEEKIHRYGLQESFRLVGIQENPYPYIKHADIFIHPSWVESQGITVLEAMALEKKCVVVRSKGTEEYVSDGVNAYQSEQNIKSLCDKIEKALCESVKDQFGDGLKNTIDGFCTQVVLSKFFSLIESDH